MSNKIVNLIKKKGALNIIRLFNEKTVECVTLLQRSNRKCKPDSYVKLSLDMEDYYRIKDAEGDAKIE